jgi:hypothetical protein
MPQTYYEKLLDDAKAELRTASWNLHRWRRLPPLSSRDDRMLAEAEQTFRKALDRSHEVQCMKLVWC